MNASTKIRMIQITKTRAPVTSRTRIFCLLPKTDTIPLIMAILASGIKKVLIE